MLRRFEQFPQRFPPDLPPRFTECLLAHANDLSGFPEILLQGVLRTFFYHTQEKIDECFKGHFPSPGEILWAFACPVEKLQAFDKMFQCLKDFTAAFISFFPILSSLPVFILLQFSP
jgi:hypothetical protein